MNRENKKKSYKKGYYKSHACNESFICKVCGRLVVPNGAGSDHRNHCPYCLSSQHLDIEPGDREADCGGTMEPVAVWVRKNGEWAIIHRCKICGTLSSNRIAADDIQFAFNRSCLSGAGAGRVLGDVGVADHASGAAAYGAEGAVGDLRRGFYCAGDCRAVGQFFRRAYRLAQCL